MREQLKALGFTYEHKDGVGTLRGDLTSIKNLVRARTSMKYVSEHNRLLVNRSYYDDPGFAGGTVEDTEKILCGDTDMRVFHEAREAFKDSEIGRALGKLVESISSYRKRKFSEHDGDWNYDRRFEIATFQESKRQLVPGRVVTIRCYPAFNGAATSFEITRFGAQVWALVDFLESTGVYTKIEYIKQNVQIAPSLSVAKTIVDVKVPGQYLNPGTLAAVFTSLFYRHAMFHTIVCMADAHGENVDNGLGSPFERETAFEYENGVIHVAAKMNQALAPQVIASITEVLKGKAA